MTNKSGCMVTIRIPREDYETVYLPLKELVTKKLGSDVCYTTITLYRAFLNAMNQVQQQPDHIEMKFLRQNVQINMGCNFNYEVKKRRRAPENLFPEDIITDKTNLLPNLISQFPQLTPQAQSFWIEELKRQGFQIMPPSQKGKTNIFWAKLSTIVKHCKAFLKWMLKLL